MTKRGLLVRRSDIVLVFQGDGLRPQDAKGRKSVQQRGSMNHE